MQSHEAVLLNLFIEAIRSPCLSKERYRNSLPISVKLQTTNSNSIHHRCIVHYFDNNPHLFGSNNKISVSGSPGKKHKINQPWECDAKECCTEKKAIAYPKGSPTTRKATWSCWAWARISWAFSSTISLSARIMGLPYSFS